jgi:hypothetical protein
VLKRKGSNATDLVNLPIHAFFTEQVIYIQNDLAGGFSPQPGIISNKKIQIFGNCIIFCPQVSGKKGNAYTVEPFKKI